ncbi:ABC transporter permease [Candidatus Woesearchaeota archaeon]|nr:ABC transporter permease [Candidatus Woesearchaeota archaeon]
MIENLLRFALTSLRHRKLRANLTIIGIVIGIAAIVSLISISDGLENAVKDQFEKVGSNKIFIAPKGVLSSFQLKQKGLTTEDFDVVEKTNGIEWAFPYLMLSSDVTLGREKKYVRNIMAVPAADTAKAFIEMDLPISSGRFFQGEDKYSVMLGSLAAKDLFKKEATVGNQLSIKEKKLRVVGILKPVGNSEDDYTIYITEEAGRELFNKEEEVNFIVAEVQKGKDIERIAEAVSKNLEKKRKNDDFDVRTPEELMAQVNTILGIIGIVLTGVAAISLLVGAIGIMNSMYTNVLERFKEIGIMKAVGATRHDIMMIFLTESVIIGLVGGTIGAILGSIISHYIGVGAQKAGFFLLKITVDWKLAMFTILFASILGAIAGYLPAKKAAKLMPAEILKD